MKKPTGNIWWVEGGDSRIEQQEGFGHCQSLEPIAGKDSIEFVPKATYDLVEKKRKDLLEDRDSLQLTTQNLRLAISEMNQYLNKIKEQIQVLKDASELCKSKEYPYVTFEFEPFDKAINFIETKIQSAQSSQLTGSGLKDNLIPKDMESKSKT